MNNEDSTEGDEGKVNGNVSRREFIKCTVELPAFLWAR